MICRSVARPAPRRRRSDPRSNAIVLAIVAVLALAGAIAAGIMHRLTVQRFAEPAGEGVPVHIALLSMGGLTARTAWNPEWRSQDAMVGVVFLGIVSVGAAIGALHWLRRWRASVRPVGPGSSPELVR